MIDASWSLPQEDCGSACLIGPLGQVTGGEFLLAGCSNSRIFITRPAPLFTPAEQIATAIKRRQSLDLRGGGLVTVSLRHAIGS